MSTPDLHTRAARFFLLAEQASRLGLSQRRLFWHGAALRVQEPAAHLPALVNAVRREDDKDLLRELAGYPIPVRLAPDAVSWHDTLIAAWEVHRASDYPDQSHIGLLAQVRLDGCGMPEGMTRPSRLPEWLEKARQIVAEGLAPGQGTEEGLPALTSARKLKALAALAAWRPAPGVTTDPETLRDWVAFWERGRRSRSPLMRGIAARARLNLPEADLRAASIPTIPAGELFHELARTIPVAARWTTREVDEGYCLLVDWRPTEGVSLPVEGLVKVAHAWLELTRHDDWQCRWIAWRQLIRWDRAGVVKTCGIDLLPTFVQSLQTELLGIGVLLEMAHWTPNVEALPKTGTDADSALLREMEKEWQEYRQSKEWVKEQYGWLGSIHLHQAGLATESHESLLRAYLSTAAREINQEFLFILGQWSPGPDAPPAVHQEWQQDWQRRMEDQNEDNREVATFTLLRQALENDAEGAMRHVALKTWRAKTMDEATHRLGGLFYRFHEVRAQLATGTLPDFHNGDVPPSVERQRPRLVLPSERRESGRWEMGSGELKIEH